MYYCISGKCFYKFLISVGCAAAAAGAFFLGISLPSSFPGNQEAVAAQKHEWGLSFQEENTAPVPNLSYEELRPYDAFYCGDTQRKRLYLTFDAGYENGNTAPILDALKKHHAPGAFFVVGHYIRENPELVKRMAAEGHIVGNHTFHHPDMSRKSETDFKKELEDLAQLYEETAGTPLPRFYRPPEGKFSDENLLWAQSLGYKTVFWSLAYVDWNTESQPSHQAAFDKLLPRTHNGAIVLLHSTSATNAEILDELLTRWENAGYTFGSLSELADLPAAAEQ